MITHSLIVALLFTAQADVPVTVDARKRLFLDDFIIANTENITRRIHPAEKYSGNPVIRPTESWEHPRICIYGSVLREGDKYRAWYYGGGDVAYAESTDGLNWTKPKQGLLEVVGQDTNLLVRRRASTMVRQRCLISTSFSVCFVTTAIRMPHAAIKWAS